MRTVRQDTEIRATPASVFSFLDQPTRLADLLPHLTNVSLDGRTRGGQYRGRILGLPVSGNIQAVDYEKPSRIVWRVDGDLCGTIRWYVSPLSTSTTSRFTYAATYRTPGPRLLRSLLTPVLHTRVRHRIERLAQNVKQRVEELQQMQEAE